MSKRKKKYKLLCIDTSYNLDEIVKRKSLHVITYRDLQGFFEKVWTLHPVVSLTNPNFLDDHTGNFKITKINERHTFIEGSAGAFRIFKYFPPLNFFLSQILLFFYILKLIRQENISAIKSGGALYTGLLGLIISKLTKLPLIVRIASNNDKIREVRKKAIEKKLFFFISIEKFFEKLVLKKATKIHAANKNNLNFAIANGADKNIASIIRYGNLIDSVHFLDPGKRDSPNEIFKEFEIQSKEFILYIGRFEKEKHPEDILKTLKEILKYDDKYKALMVGDGSMKSTLIDLSYNLNIADSVVFTGVKDQLWLSKIIPHAKLTISPHTGRSLCEVALGKSPVVGYDIDWQSEIIDHGVNGYLAKYRDIQNLKKYAVNLINNKNTCNSFENLIRQKALNLLDPQKIMNQEIDEYLQVFNHN